MTTSRICKLTVNSLVLVSLLGCMGCSTLASLGLPVGNTQNALIAPAKNISEAPGHALLLPKELNKQTLPNYVVEPGDTLLIEPVKFDSTIRLPGDQVVKPDGYISLGEFGRYFATNKTIDQIQVEVQSIINEQLRRNLETAYEIERRERESTVPSSNLDPNPNRTQLSDLPLETAQDREALVQLNQRIQDAIKKNQVAARLINWDSKKFYVLGEVNSPGSFVFSGNQTILDAIIEAGGINSRANKHQIIISRPSTCSDCRVVMKVCYDQIVQLGNASTNYQLQPGDRVFVPSLTFFDDVKQTLRGGRGVTCPRCADCQRGCVLPEGCE